MTCSVGMYLSTSAADSGTISADSELGDFVASNLLSPAADLAWRGNTTSTLQIDLAQPSAIDCVALCIHSLSASAVITIDLYNDRASDPVQTITRLVGEPRTTDTLNGMNSAGFNSFGWNGVDVVDRVAYANFIEIFDPVTVPVTAQYIDITIQDDDSVDGFIEVRRLKLGLLTRPSDQFDWGYRFGFVSGKGYRAGSVTWSWNTHDELAAFNELILSHGADPSKLARTRSGELLGFDDDLLWIGKPEATGLTRYQHIALVALVGATIPYRPNSVLGIATINIEEVYYGIISS